MENLFALCMNFNCVLACLQMKLAKKQNAFQRNLHILATGSRASAYSLANVSSLMTKNKRKFQHSCGHVVGPASGLKLTSKFRNKRPN
jgi:hypothetical protein